MMDNRTKPYRRPRLEIYDNVQDITDAAGMMGAADGAAHGMTKTS
jgi:hypothetical protein